jgi:hypothetical protein
VSPSGSDTTGNGSSGAPWATLQYAYNWIQAHIDFAGYTVTIQMADGTYSAGLIASGTPIGATSETPIIVQGNMPTPTNVTINVAGTDAISATGGATLQVQGLHLIATGTDSDGLSAFFAGAIYFQNVDFGPCSVAHVDAGGGGAVSAFGNYRISGGAAIHFWAQSGGYIGTPDAGITITLSGTPNFSDAFAVATTGGQIESNYATVFAGSGATGIRYNANTNGVISTNGGGPHYFPGSVEGSPPYPKILPLTGPNAGRDLSTGGIYA